MDLLNLWNLFNIYSSPSFPLQLQTYQTLVEQSRKWGDSTGLLGVVLVCLPLPTTDLLYLTLLRSSGCSTCGLGRRRCKHP